MRVQIANKTMFNNALSTLFPQHNFSEVNGFTIDSRLVEKGDVYLSLKGENIDGHNYDDILKNSHIVIQDVRRSSADVIFYGIEILGLYSLAKL